MRAKRRKSGASRWSAWAAQLGSRFERHAHLLAMSWLLHTRSCRTKTLVERRWFGTMFDHRPQFHLSLQFPTAFEDRRVFLKAFNLLTLSGSSAQRASAAARIPSAAGLERAGRERVLRHRHTATSVLESRTSLERVFERRSLEHSDFHSRRSTERLIHRRDRIERDTSIDRTIIFRRDPGGAARSPGETVAPIGMRAGEGSGRALQPRPSPPDQPQINVDQLADQVIRQIDRRIVARRERMGRT